MDLALEGIRRSIRDHVDHTLDASRHQPTSESIRAVLNGALDAILPVNCVSRINVTEDPSEPGVVSVDLVLRRSMDSVKIESAVRIIERTHGVKIRMIIDDADPSND